MTNSNSYAMEPNDIGSALIGKVYRKFNGLRHARTQLENLDVYTPSKKAKEHIDKIKSFRELEDGWNGYTAGNIEEIAIKNAIDLVTRLDKVGQDIYFIVSTPSGGIELKLKNHNKSVEIDLYDDGNGNYAFLKSNEEEEEGTLAELTDNKIYAISVWLTIGV